MISSVKHGPDQMIETTVYTCENFITGILNNIHGCNKITGFTNNKFSRLKPNLEMTIVFFLVPVKFFFYFFTEQWNVSSFLTWHIRHFESTAKIKYLQIRKMLCHLKQYFNAFSKYFHIF